MSMHHFGHDSISLIMVSGARVYSYVYNNLGNKVCNTTK